MADLDNTKKPEDGELKDKDVVQNPVVPKVETKKDNTKEASGE